MSDSNIRVIEGGDSQSLRVVARAITEIADSINVKVDQQIHRIANGRTHEPSMGVKQAEREYEQSQLIAARVEAAVTLHKQAEAEQAVPEGYDVWQLAGVWTADTKPKIEGNQAIATDGTVKDYNSPATKHPTRAAAIQACLAHQRRQMEESFGRDLGEAARAQFDKAGQAQQGDGCEVDKPDNGEQDHTEPHTRKLIGAINRLLSCPALMSGGAYEQSAIDHAINAIRDVTGVTPNDPRNCQQESEVSNG